MKVAYKKDLVHKVALYSLLTKLFSDPVIANHIYFKGGTCASMLGYLDRFSVDLDFDLLNKDKKDELRSLIHRVVKELDWEIKDESKNDLQFFIKYRDEPYQKSTLKLEITDIVSSENKYEKVYLVEIDKYCQAQTIETMFANKLIALKARWEKTEKIAGRDMYDIWYFLKQGYGINQGVIRDFRKNFYAEYIGELIGFITEYVSEKILYEDLNPLMTKEKLNKVVPNIKSQVLIGLRVLTEDK